MVSNHGDTGQEDASASSLNPLGLEPRAGEAHSTSVRDASLSSLPAQRTQLPGSPPAERLPRYEEVGGDAALVELLQKYGFDSTLGQETIRVLVGYGMTVMNGWLRSGHIATLVRKVIPEYQVYQIWNDQEAEELIADSLSVGLAGFQKKILGREWNADFGASLKTYFMYGCVFAFKKSYANLVKTKNRLRQIEEAEIPGAVPEHPEEAAIRRALLRQKIQESPNRLQKILFLRSHGYSISEIAEMLGCTYKTVESALGRWRRNNSEGAEFL